jgi:hypothetical protein
MLATIADLTKTVRHLLLGDIIDVEAEYRNPSLVFIKLMQHLLPALSTRVLSYSAKDQRVTRFFNQSDFHALLGRHHLDSHVRTFVQNLNAKYSIHYVLKSSFVDSYLPGFDTLHLHRHDDLIDEVAVQSVKQQILVSLLSSPIELVFPSYSELLSAINMRELIVCAARKTSMAFNTDLVDRPIEYWDYKEDVGFILKPGKSLIEALLLATQPDRSGRLYGFSCYRATEYVILLAIAQEAQHHNPQLFVQLEEQWQHKAVMSGKFHDVFLHELGTNEKPLPPMWFVPGDRVWFRNPDDASSNVPGYEGSWVIYLGHGQFANFWQQQAPFDLVGKCLEEDLPPLFKLITGIDSYFFLK